MKMLTVPVNTQRAFARNFWPLIASLALLMSLIPVLDPTPAFEIVNGRIVSKNDDGFHVNVGFTGEFSQPEWRAVWKRLYSCRIDRQLRDSEGKWHTLDSYDLRVPQQSGESFAAGQQFKVSVFWPSGTATYYSTAHCYRNLLGFEIPQAAIEMPGLRFEVKEAKR